MNISDASRPEFIIPVYLELEELEYAVGVVFLTTLGILGNIIAILKIVCDPTFHKPTYIVLATLIFADFICLIQYIVHAAVENVNRPIGNEYGEFFMALTYTTTHASAAHVILFLGLRYFYIRNPIKARLIQTSAIIRWSISLWIFSAVFGALYHVFRFCIPRIDIQVVVLSFRGYLLIVPVCFMVFFHIQKVHELHHAINIPGLNRHIRRMSRMLSVIVFIYILSALLFPICFILNYNKVCKDEKECTHILIIARIMWLVNVSANPIIYFIYTSKARVLFRAIFKKFIRRHRHSRRDLIGTQVPPSPVISTKL
ncbi:uncharacterized protein LOC133188901 [Saccostrea echinata]|uniref:uncharacterized protein LOC133188901 n=1 Tax=Saccostrea echinata TaxID=191078 RepID=UPI002A812923|nr:uncharacterized protein LOC133188901 [Saccostrea echinata]